MLRFLFSCFILTIRPHAMRIDPVLEDFSNLVSLAGVTALLFPTLRFRSGSSPCEEDKDCFGAKKCCQLYFEKFCCDPREICKNGTKTLL